MSKAEEKREQVVQKIADLMRTSPFNVEYRAKKKPKGIKVIIEVTEEQMNYVVEQAKKTNKNND